MKYFIALLVWGLVARVSFSQEIWSKYHYVKEGETLSEIIYQFVEEQNDLFKIYGHAGILKLIKKYNPHITNIHKIEPGTRIYLELPYETKPEKILNPIVEDEPNTLEPIAEEEPVEEEVSEVEEPKEEVQEEDDSDAWRVWNFKAPRLTLDIGFGSETVDEKFSASDISAKKSNSINARVSFEYLFLNKWLLSHTEFRISKTDGGSLDFPMEMFIDQKLVLAGYHHLIIYPFIGFNIHKSAHVYLNSIGQADVSENSSSSLTFGFLLPFNYLDDEWQVGAQFLKGLSGKITRAQNQFVEPDYSGTRFWLDYRPWDNYYVRLEMFNWKYENSIATADAGGFSYAFGYSF